MIEERPSPGFSSSGRAKLALKKREKKRGETIQVEDSKLTGVGHELEGAAEIAVAGRRAGAHVEDVGGERRETFDVGVSGGRLDDPVASLVLVLRRDDRRAALA